MGNSNGQHSAHSSANQVLSIKALSWKGDSQCLFDFESKDITKKKITVKNSGFLAYNQMKEIVFCEYLHDSANYLLAIDHSAYVIWNGTRFSTFAAKNPTCPYIVLEKLQKDSNETKSQLVICFATPPKEPLMPRMPQNILRIGRGAGSEIRVNDISVSREHAHLILKDKRVYLKDLNSKFGTLALVRTPIPFSYVWNKVSIQIGKTVLELKLKTPSSLFSCTSSQSENSNNNYYKNENALDEYEQMRASAMKMFPKQSNILQPQQYGRQKSSEKKNAFDYNVS